MARHVVLGGYRRTRGCIVPTSRRLKKGPIRTIGESEGGLTFMNRRSFLKQTTSTLAITRTAAGSVSLPAPRGNHYERVVPATLDLAERALLGLHHFDRIADERL